MGPLICQDKRTLFYEVLFFEISRVIIFALTHRLLITKVSRLKLQPGSSVTLRGIKGTQGFASKHGGKRGIPFSSSLQHIGNPQPWLPRPLRSPQSLLPSQSSKDVLDVGVVTSRFGDGDPELSIAKGSHSCNETRHDPDDKSKAHGARILQHTLWRDEDSRANDVPCMRHQR